MQIYFCLNLVSDLIILQNHSYSQDFDTFLFIYLNYGIEYSFFLILNLEVFNIKY